MIKEIKKCPAERTRIDLENSLLLWDLTFYQTILGVEKIEVTKGNNNWRETEKARNNASIPENDN